MLRIVARLAWACVLLSEPGIGPARSAMHWIRSVTQEIPGGEHTSLTLGGCIPATPRRSPEVPPAAGMAASSRRLDCLRVDNGCQLQVQVEAAILSPPTTLPHWLSYMRVHSCVYGRTRHGTTWVLVRPYHDSYLNYSTGLFARDLGEACKPVCHSIFEF